VSENSLKISSFRSFRDFVAHQNANLIHLLPFVLEPEQRANFEVAGRDVDRLRDLAPVVEIAQDLPVHVAVIHDEKFTSALAGTVGH
jgi:hypothetical protein